MFSTPSSSGKNKAPEASKASNSIDSGTPVEVVRFVSQFMVGRVLEPKSSLTDGERFRGGTVQLSYLNDTFLAVRFVGVDGKDTYTQLIPWAAVATVILK